MCSFDSPGEPWTEEDHQNRYNQMNPEDAEDYQRGDALLSLSGTISALEQKAEELAAVSRQGQQRDDVVSSLSDAASTLKEVAEELKQTRDTIRNNQN